MEKKPKSKSRYPLALPPELHERVRVWAERHRRSVNQEMVYLIEMSCDQLDRDYKENS